MKLWLPFALLGGLCVAAALVTEALAARLTWFYVAANFFCLSLACRFGWSRLWLKRTNGTLSPMSYVLLLPLHILNRISSFAFRAVLKEAAAHCVAPNVWLGRRINASEAVALFGEVAPSVLDLTSEFPEAQQLRTGGYLCLPVLDHSAPTQLQLRAGVDFISNSRKDYAVFVHCALGHGRSATVVAAWMLQNNPELTIAAAVQQLKAIRSGVHINSEQRAALEIFRNELKRENG